MITSGFVKIVESQPGEPSGSPFGSLADPTRRSAGVRATDAEKAGAIAMAAACLERALCAAGLGPGDLLRLRGEIERAALRSTAFEVVR